jgi:gliding motility-associated-like protein
MRTALVAVFVSFGVWLVPSAQAQNKLAKRFNVWYFGQKGGIDFNTGSPLTDGRVNSATWESTAVICDENGALQFYTDGVDVYTRTHQTMPGSDKLGGDYSSTQGALIVPQPGSTTRFFVFSASDVEKNNGPMQLAEVDLSQNGGLGAVVAKNRVLLPRSTEKILAVPHCNGIDYWVIAHEAGSNQFAVFLVNSAGVQTPSFQGIGTTHAVGYDCVGYLKASPSGNRLAAAVFGQNRVELFDFDNAAGTLSNPVSISAACTKSAYGLEFSVNGKYLYVGGSGTEKTLYQLDLSQQTGAALGASAVVVGQTNAQALGALQLGPDGRIYVANFQDNNNAALRGWPTLGVVNQPDQRGTACNYNPEGFSLGGSKSSNGLPNLIAGFCRKKPDVQCQQVVGGACGGGLLRAVVTNTDTVTYQWFREGVAIPGATQSTYKPNVAGKFWVQIKEVKPCPQTAKSNEVDVSLLQTGGDLKPQTVPRTCGTFLLKIAAAPGSAIQWSGPGVSGPAAGRDSLLVSGQRGQATYKVSVTNPADPTCKSDTTLTVNFTTPPPYKLPQNALSAACGQGVALNAPASSDYDSFRWRLPDGQVVAQNPYVARSGGTFTVLARSTSAGCESRDSVVVTFQGGAAPPTLSPSFTQCPADPVPTLSATGQNVTWYADSTLSRPLATGNSFRPTLSGNPGEVVFFATQTSGQGCASRAAKTSIRVAEAPKLTLEKAVNACFADNQTARLDAGTGPGWQYQWFRNGTPLGSTQTLTVNAAGTYRVRVAGPTGCAATDSSVVVEFCKPLVFVPDVFTPNGDGVNDTFAPKGQFISGFELVVYNRWGEVVHAARGVSFEAAQASFWNGTVAGQAAPTGVYAWKLRVESPAWPEPFVKSGFVTLAR